MSLLETLAKLGHPIERELDEKILALLATSLAFDEDELITLIEDMMREPEKKPALLAVLEESRAEELALKERHPEEYAERADEQQLHWGAVMLYFKRKANEG